MTLAVGVSRRCNQTGRDHRIEKVHNEVLINPNDCKRLISMCQSAFIIAQSYAEVKALLGSANQANHLSLMQRYETDNNGDNSLNIEENIIDNNEDIIGNDEIISTKSTSNGNSNDKQLFSSDMEGDLLEATDFDSEKMLSGRIESLFMEAKPNLTGFKGFRGFTAGLCGFNVGMKDQPDDVDLSLSSQTPAQATISSDGNGYRDNVNRVEAKRAEDEDEGENDGEERSIRFVGHIVIILIEHENQTLDAAILDIVYCLMSIRKYFNKKVLVLSERGDEMSERTTEIASKNRIKLDSLYFFHGNPRNQNHLRACFVHLARSIILLKSEVDTQSVHHHVLFPEKTPSHLNQSPQEFRQHNDQVFSMQVHYQYCYYYHHYYSYYQLLSKLTLTYIRLYK